MTENISNTPRRRVLSGMRPTGRLHLGNYMGALYNWVKLQHEYECYFFIADWHALTTDYADPSRLQQNTLDVALDFLASGLDPDKCTIFVQSHVPEHAELNLLFSMFTPLSWLERVPSYKDQQAQLKEKDLNTYGFLGYPLLQAADILLYQPDFVPVGQDQVAHVELTREVTRRFNFLYPLAPHLKNTLLAREEWDEFVRTMGSREDAEAVVAQGQSISFRPGTSISEYEGDNVVFREPRVLLTPSPKLPGIDGRKMSKSYGNTIMLTDQAPIVRSKMESMSNGGQRFIQSDPGNPDICPVGDMHKVFSSAEKTAYIENGCRSAAIGCLACKRLAGDSIVQVLEPIQTKRFQLESDLDGVNEILVQGAEKASVRAVATMNAVRSAMGLSKNLNGAKIGNHLDRVFQALGNPSVHNLQAHKDWWDLDAPLRASFLRTYWLDHILPRDIVLSQDSDRVYITAKKKRVFITSAREMTLGVWEFHAKPKTYEMLVLLCWEKESKLLYSFVVPQKVYIKEWSLFKKQNKNNDINFKVTKNNRGEFSFQLEDLESVNIGEFQSNFEQMQ